MARVDDTLAPTRGRLRRVRGLRRDLRAVGWQIVAWSPVIVLLIAWEAVARSGAVTPFTLPTFRACSNASPAMRPPATCLSRWASRLWRALAGFVISAVPASCSGSRWRAFAAFNWFFDPIVSVGFPIPKIAFLPIIVLWLGFFDLSKITMIVFNTIFPVITATVVGMCGVEKEIIWSARNLGTGERAMMWDVLLPAAMPQIFTGLQVALPIAMIVGILTEMAMGGYGIGASMQTASRLADSLGVFAGIVEIAVVGYVLVKLMSLVRARLLVWHPEALEPTTV